MTLAKNLIVSPEAIAKQVGDEIVILHVGNGTYFGLDAVGSRIWQLMAERKSPSEICEAVLEEYDVSREDLERDIIALIKDLVAQDLISTS